MADTVPATSEELRSLLPENQEQGAHKAIIMLIAVIVAAYLNSLSGVWLYDDELYILKNAALKSLWPPTYAVGNTRPILFLTLACNYAFGNYNIIGYHLVNITIHIINALLLFAIVRKSLVTGKLRSEFGTKAVPLALVCALSWSLHPVNTMCISYVWQRGEALMSMFYLFTLYAFIKGCNTGKKSWYIVALLFCFLGMGSKEVMFTCPLLIFLYDRALIAGSSKNLWAKRKWFYSALGATWIFLTILVLTGSTGFHTNKAIGFSSLKCSPAEYLLTMPGVYLYYLKLAFLPQPLCFDYDWKVATSLTAELPNLAFLLVILTFTALFLYKNRCWAMVAAAFFIVFLPTSSIMPMPDPLIEYRLYLPLTALTVLTVLCGYRGLKFALGNISVKEKRDFLQKRVLLGVPVLWVVVLALLTVNRNFIYTNEIALWRNTARLQPDNKRARYNLGHFLLQAGNPEAALPELQATFKLCPGDKEISLNLGNVLALLNRREEAVKYYQYALTIDSQYVEAHNNLGNTFSVMGRFSAAMRHFEQALDYGKNQPKVFVNIGCSLVRQKKLPEAIKYFRKALKLQPNYADACYNLGLALWQSERKESGKKYLQQALNLNPDFTNAKIALQKLAREQP